MAPFPYLPEEREAAAEAISSEWPHLLQHELVGSSGLDLENIAVNLQMRLRRSEHGGTAWLIDKFASGQAFGYDITLGKPGWVDYNSQFAIRFDREIDAEMMIRFWREVSESQGKAAFSDCMAIEHRWE
jgi:hypothetical protein